MDAGEFWARHADYTEKLHTVIDRVPGVGLLETAKFFCTQDTCDMSHDGDDLFRDVNHLNDKGTLYLGRALVAEHPELATPQG